MEKTETKLTPSKRPVWNSGRTVGAKRALKPKQIWEIRFYLNQRRRLRDRALFDLAIDSKLRGCDLVQMKIGDIVSGGQIRTRAILMQQKTGWPVQFELLPDSRTSLLAWLERRGGSVDDYVFPSRIDRNGHLSTRQYARLVDEWVTGVSLMRSDYGTHSLRRTKASIIYRATGSRGSAEARIQAICRLEAGTRLVSLLAADQLLRDDITAGLLAGEDKECAVTEGPGNEASSGEQFLIFRMGEDEFALPVSAVEEVVTLPERLVRLPRAPDFVKGVINLRGEVIPVIDQAQRFGAATGTSARRRIIVARVDTLRAGFVVDAVSQVLRLGAAEIERTTNLLPGYAYIARGDADVVIAMRPDGVVAMSAPKSPAHFWHPSVERMVESAVQVLPPGRLVGVMMTGMGTDGAAAMAGLRQRGGRTIAESAESAVIWGMPGALAELGGADSILPLSQIAPALIKMFSL